MNTLEDTQAKFTRFILYQDEQILSYLNPKNAVIGLNIYRNNVLYNLIRALRLTYPGVWKLIGDECATNLSRQFLSNPDNFPKEGALESWGEEFVDFIANHKQISEMLPYLSDYARYEWVRHQVLLSPCDKPIKIDKEYIGLIKKDQDVNISLTHSLHFLKSSFPIIPIAEIIQNQKTDNIELYQQNTFGIMYRVEDTVIEEWLPYRRWLFLQILQECQSLQKTNDKLHNQYDDFNLIDNLVYLFNTQLITRMD